MTGIAVNEQACFTRTNPGAHEREEEGRKEKSRLDAAGFS
jgi:hypothetical protein